VSEHFSEPLQVAFDRTYYGRRKSFQGEHVQRRSNERSHLILNVLQVCVARKTQTTYGGEQTAKVHLGAWARHALVCPDPRETTILAHVRLSVRVEQGDDPLIVRLKRLVLRERLGRQVELVRLGARFHEERNVPLDGL